MHFIRQYRLPRGEARAIKKALDEAGLKPEDIDFISAHGTSTPLGDKTETGAIKLSFGKSAYHIPVTSVKSADRPYACRIRCPRSSVYLDEHE